MRRCQTTASGFLLTWLWVSAGVAHGQSSALIDALRVHASDVTSLAQGELDQCVQSRCLQLGPLSLLLGTLRLADGEPAAARSQLNAWPVPEPFKPYKLFYEGEADFYLEDYSPSASHFEKAAQLGSPVLALHARTRQAEALLQGGDFKRALPLLNEVLRETSSPELLMDKLQADEASSDDAAWASDAHTLLVRYPASAVALEVAQSFPSHRRVPRLTLEERLARARALLEAKSATRALAELVDLEKESPKRSAQEKAEVALTRAQALFAQGKESEADGQVTLALKGDVRCGSEALLSKAKHMMRGPGAHPDAQKLLQEIERRYPRQAAGEEAGFLAGWLLIQAGSFLEGAALLSTYDSRHPQARKKDETAWYAAYALIRAGHLADAEGALTRLLQRFPRTQLGAQVHYWIARCHQLAGSNALGDYREVISQSPGSFYSVLAVERLREAGQNPPTQFAVHPLVLPDVLSPELDLARTLARAGLLKDAQEEIARRAGSVHAAEAAANLGQALAQMDEYGAAYALASRLLWGDAFVRRSPQALALLYPRAFAPALEANAHAQGVSPFILWAIMRRESVFRPNLMSAANARGLMQLVPPTATAIAKVLKESPPAPDALFSPAINLRLAAWYVGQLQSRFHHPVLIASAYNAGPPAAARWATQFGDLPTDLFVEAIPYKETRIYVKQVVADLFNYQEFYGGPKDTQHLDFHIPAPAESGVNF